MIRKLGDRRQNAHVLDGPKLRVHRLFVLPADEAVLQVPHVGNELRAVRNLGRCVLLAEGEVTRVAVETQEGQHAAGAKAARHFGKDIIVDHSHGSAGRLGYIVRHVSLVVLFGEG